MLKTSNFLILQVLDIIETVSRSSRYLTLILPSCFSLKSYFSFSVLRQLSILFRLIFFFTRFGEYEQEGSSTSLTVVSVENCSMYIYSTFFVQSRRSEYSEFDSEVMRTDITETIGLVGTSKITELKEECYFAESIFSRNSYPNYSDKSGSFHTSLTVSLYMFLTPFFSTKNTEFC